MAHTGGADTVASVVQFIDGLPFKPGYKRLRIRGVEGIDDVASIHEAVLRRFHRLAESEVMPDILLIDGGKGQLRAATSALEGLPIDTPPLVISLAKREELIFRAGEDEPLRLSRHSLCPAAVAVRPRRGPSFRPALSPHPPPPIHAGRVTAEGGSEPAA